MEMTALDRVISLVASRDVHIRAYVGQERYELWADGRWFAAANTTDEAILKLEEWMTTKIGLTREQLNEAAEKIVDRCMP